MCSHLDIDNSVIENQILLILWFMYYIKVFFNYFCYSLYWEKKKIVLPIWQQTSNFLSVDTRERAKYILFCKNSLKYSGWNLQANTRNGKEGTSMAIMKVCLALFSMLFQKSRENLKKVSPCLYCFFNWIVANLYEGS